MKIYERELHLKEHSTATIPLSFVIVTDSIEYCYHFLYVIHNTWKAEPTYFHDYINSPKINGYRGLHTTIVTEDGRKVTFKIRTKEMDTYFKKGITTYCFQEGAQSFWLPRWISDLQYVTAEKRDHSQDFWEQLQHDILEESIMVYTNQGVTLLLPNHSTVLDAAFYAYREKALFVDKILVNGDPVPLYHALRAYDSVFFSFSEESRVTNEWLQYVDTSLASTFVKEGLVKVDATAKIHIGKNALALELQKVGRGHIEELHPRSLAHLITTFQVDSLDHIYRKIGEGLLTATEVVQSITGYTHTPLSRTRSLLIEGPFAPILTLLHKILLFLLVK
jgi:guanosine-3',5'-bis(diphosphate) 3'-pyrophosphohydrolase